MILKVVGCEDCVRDNYLALLGPAVKPPAAGQSLQIFLEKNICFNAIWMTFCTFLEQ